MPGAEEPLQPREMTRLAHDAKTSVDLALFDEMPIAVLACDRDLQTTHWNAFAERLTGRPASAVLGRPLADVIQPTDRTREAARGLVDAARAGARWLGELETVVS